MTLPNYRRYKKQCDNLLLPFGVDMETIAYYPNYNPQYYYKDGIPLELNMKRDITFADLEGLSQLFDTKNINISPSENGYYDSFEHSKLHIAIDALQVDKWFYTIEETAEQEQKERENEKRRQQAHLQSEANRLGYKLVKETK